MSIVVNGKKLFYLLHLSVFAVISFLVMPSIMAQGNTDFFTDSVSIRDCLSYGLKHQPLVSQLKIDEDITDQAIRSRLSDWLPVISSSAGVQHYIKQPVSIFPDFTDPTGPKREVTIGVRNTSTLQFSINQKILSSDLLFAGSTAKYYRRQVKQSRVKETVQLVVDISKAFYDVLLTQEMLSIINEDIDRLTKEFKDALAMYNNGLKDKTDYSRATLSLNSAISDRISITNSITSKLTYLKQLMGYPDDKALMLKRNYSDMKKEMTVDTLQNIDYHDRIEYQILQTDLMLQKLTIGYQKQGFMPELSGFANYNLAYQNDDFSQLFNKSFPNSIVGLTLSFPLFEGTRRLHDLKRSRLLYNRMALDTINLKEEMNTGYITALSSYKDNLAAYNLTLQNIGIARDIYNTVYAQYKEGIKPYFEVIISETDLRTAQLNNLSSLIRLMFSKIDAEQAAGRIPVDY